jgi:superfamily II DNA or RNA helicase
MGLDSSPIKSTQRTGRVVRKEGSKYAEMFTLVLENTKTPDFLLQTYLDLKEAGFNFNYDIGHDYVSGSKLKEMFLNLTINL